MNPEQDSFGALRRLLAWKRHEQPPPGYFDRFSGQVMARLRAGERPAESLLERWFGVPSWFEGSGIGLEAKPILGSAFGVAVCGVLLFGVIAAEKPDPASVTLSDPSGVFQAAIPASQNARFAQRPSSGLSISNGIVRAESTGGSLFGDLKSPDVTVPVNYLRPASGQ